MTFHFEFCSLAYAVGFGSGSCRFFTFMFDSVLGKTLVLVWFVLAGFGFFPSSNQPTTEMSNSLSGVV